MKNFTMLYLDSNIDWNFWLEYLFGGWNWLVSIPLIIFGIAFIGAMIKEGIDDDGGMPWLPF